MSRDAGPRAGDGKTLTLPYSMDLDPAGIRALVSDAICGAMALGAQNESPAPEGHWLAHFWQLGRQHDEWRATVWAVARALNCLPSTFSDANGHVLRAAERLMAERAAAPAAAPAWQPIETAPKDGTQILAWIDWYDGAQAATGKFLNGKFWPDHRNTDSKWPTHWMPLPAAPGVQAPATADGDASHG